MQQSFALHPGSSYMVRIGRGFNTRTGPPIQTEENEDQLEIFCLDAAGNQQIPTITLGAVAPDFNRKHNLLDIKANIDSLKKYLTFEQYQWWQMFLAESCSTNIGTWTVSSARHQQKAMRLLRARSRPHSQ